MRLSDESGSTPSTPPTLPNTEAVYTFDTTDGQSPTHHTLYFLTDISPFLSTPDLYGEDVKATRSQHSTEISWVVCSLVNGRDSATGATISTEMNTLPTPPAKNSVLVVNGNSPRTGLEQDYHDWYDQEHGAALTNVPGWNNNRRYKCEKVYLPAGGTDVADAEKRISRRFFGFNFYDETNGLGGPEWKKGTNTVWTERIRGNAECGNLRRVWRVM
ncbi:uncharacterized protein AB675_11160 [Cyphellophora attinorum]|uniref:Uncharacterized protein n=1 Tax=Cyphellophora attinorum TaxID=1664694 RepID=A0A0N1NYJ8_9EURO|nr:uncharacterized protein AB675_11160 [Phialophora attinorum]KPI35844.1 hypothetical protein AB675_11160 [Phialophora attinorum]